MTANAGYHAYATGDVLTAAQVQYNLQNQTVMYFATASARTTALSGVVVEGMVSYVPANGLEYYNGSAWVTLSTGGDITAVTAGTGLTGGGTTGAVTLNLGTTAKGDLVAGTGASTAAALTVGANDTVLTADSTAATGLKWATASAGSTNVAGKNGVLNSNFSVWQRGTSIPMTATAYVADRWQGYRNPSGATTTRQATSDTTNLPNIQYCARVQRDLANASTVAVYIGQSFESVNSIPYAGKTITFSFYARKGANYSATSDLLNVNLGSGTGTDQNYVTTGFTGSVTVINQNATLTTTWQRFTYSAAVGATATELGFYFQYNPTGVAGVNDYFEVTGVQLEIAGSASAYSPNTSTYQAELAACQRYLPVLDNSAGTDNSTVNGYAYAATGAIYTYPFAVQARVQPTGMTVSGGFNAYALNSPTTVTPTFGAGSVNNATLLASLTITAGQGSRIYATAGAKILFTGCEL